MDGKISPEQIIRELLPKVKLLQLATSDSGQPWLCTVHFYNDDNLNFYWISTPERRHSKEIAQNEKVAGYVLLHENTPKENYVIGLSFEGRAEYLGNEVPGKIGRGYIEKTGRSTDITDDIRTGKNPHKFYRLTPTKFVLFDSKNFPKQPRQEWVSSRNF